MNLRWLKPLLFATCLVPFGILVYRVISGSIPGDPVEAMTETTGQWALRLLLITLSITPLRRLLNLPGLIRYRRMLGLFAFFYACCHFLVYLVFDQFFDFSEIWHDIVERKYIFAGMLALTLLIPLAITSTNAMVRRLGGKRWQALHRLVYVIAIAAVTHYFWQVKADADIELPALYAVILAALLGYRMVYAKKRPR